MKQQDCSKPEVETILLQSVLCSKKVRLVASAKSELFEKLHKDTDIRFQPDPHHIKISSFLMKDFVILQGSIEGNLIVDNVHHTRITLLFQEEIVCEGACPGDVLKHTPPVIEGVIPPQTVGGLREGSCTIIFKVIVSTQITVIREKLGEITVNVIGDINDDRCKSSSPSDAVVPKGDCHHCHDIPTKNHQKTTDQ